MKSEIAGASTLITENGTMEVSTPKVTSTLGNKIETKSAVANDGKVSLSATKTLPNGDIVDVPLGSYGEGTEVNIKEENGAVIVEIITKLGTKTLTLRKAR